MSFAWFSKILSCSGQNLPCSAAQAPASAALAAFVVDLQEREVLEDDAHLLAVGLLDALQRGPTLAQYGHWKSENSTIVTGAVGGALRGIVAGDDVEAVRVEQDLDGRLRAQLAHVLGELALQALLAEALVDLVERLGLGERARSGPCSCRRTPWPARR